MRSLQTSDLLTAGRVARLWSKTENSRLEAAVDVVRHEQQHAELLQSDELHVPLITLTHLQPLQQGVGVHIRHDG